MSYTRIKEELSTVISANEVEQAVINLVEQDSKTRKAIIESLSLEKTHAYISGVNNFKHIVDECIQAGKASQYSAGRQASEHEVDFNINFYLDPQFQVISGNFYQSYKSVQLFNLNLLKKLNQVSIELDQRKLKWELLNNARLKLNAESKQADDETKMVVPTAEYLMAKAALTQHEKTLEAQANIESNLERQRTALDEALQKNQRYHAEFDKTVKQIQSKNKANVEYYVKESENYRAQLAELQKINAELLTKLQTQQENKPLVNMISGEAFHAVIKLYDHTSLFAPAESNVTLNNLRKLKNTAKDSYSLEEIEKSINDDSYKLIFDNPSNYGAESLSITGRIVRELGMHFRNPMLTSTHKLGKG